MKKNLVFKGNKKIIYIFCGIFTLVIAAHYFLPKPINWSHTYLSKDKVPFGCYAAYTLANGVYSKTFTLNKQTLYNLNNTHVKSSSLIIINDNINLSKTDLRSLFQFLNKGNTIFIAVNQFNGALADTFHLKTDYDFQSNFTAIDSLIKRDGETIRMKASNLKTKSYGYTKVATSAYFTNFDTTRFNVLATFKEEKSCLISAQIGKGKLFLMSMPDVFTNYFVVNHSNRELTYTLLSLIKNETVIWDDYYKTYNPTNYSFIKFILESDALYTAYLLVLIGIIGYMITEGRRKQRIIPNINAPINSTLEFVNVVSHVYYNSKSHQSIAAQKIKFFYETIRQKFNVNTNTISEVFFDEVSILSGIEKKLVKQLFVYCEKIKQASEITELELIELNRQIHNFNKNSLR